MIQPIFISVDPKRDDPETVQGYIEGVSGHAVVVAGKSKSKHAPFRCPSHRTRIAEFHERIIGLTGTLPQIKHVCRVRLPQWDA